MDRTKRGPRLVGNYIRQKREAMGLSQRALGMQFDPPVTTQFISNVERGVTPLPPAHVPFLVQALHVDEAELLTLMEQEYALKLTGMLGFPEVPQILPPQSYQAPTLTVSTTDFSFISSLYRAYQLADPKTREAFANVCKNMLAIHN